MKKNSVFLIVVLTVLIMVSDAMAAIGFTDDFENGSIDTNRWVVGGRRTSYTSSDQGSWQWQHDEIIDSSDGYLRTRVWGPTSAGSYGAAGWIRTVDNFNDGMNYTLNFTWNADVSDDYHTNVYVIQVTDCYVAPFEESPGSPWNWEAQEGTTNLLWGS